MVILNAVILLRFGRSVMLFFPPSSVLGALLSEFHLTSSNPFFKRENKTTATKTVRVDVYFRSF